MSLLLRPAARAAVFVSAMICVFAGCAQARDAGERRLIVRGHHERFTGSEHSLPGGYDDRDTRPYRSDGRERLRDAEARAGWRVRKDRGLPALHARHRHRSDRWADNGQVNDDVKRGWREGRRYRPFVRSRVTGEGGYAGAVSAWHTSVNGTYFTIQRYGYVYGDRAAGDARSGVSSRVIIADPHAASRSCSFEAGVCVIRGR